jgi:thymidylate synthase
MKNNVDKQYIDCIKYILDNGIKKNDRTGTGTLSVFDLSMKFKMSEGFPLLTSKKMFLKGVIHELIWFLNGDTNIKYLIDNDVHIWDGDAYKKYDKITKKYSGCCPECGEGYQNDKDGENNDICICGNDKKSSKLSIKEFVSKIKTDPDFAKIWGELGPIYGKQWTDWGGHTELQEVGGYHYGGSFSGAVHKVGGQMKELYIKGINQIQNLINDLKTNPDSRRLIVNAWNVGEIDQMTLPPCHFGFQCYTFELNFEERLQYWLTSLGKSKYYGLDINDEDLDRLNIPKRYLTLKWFQRSCDFPLGIPVNIASYGLLLHLLAKEVNMIPYELIFNGGDCHIYLDQIDGIKKQLTQETFELPKLILNNNSLHELKYEDVKIIDYKSSPTIKFPLSN